MITHWDTPAARNITLELFEDGDSLLSAHTATPFDIILLDIVMPLLNGIETAREGHGYGCYSIQTITQRNGGLCSFEAENGVFSLRLSFPLPDDYGNQETNNTRPKNGGSDHVSGYVNKNTDSAIIAIKLYHSCWFLMKSLLRQG